MDKSSKIYVTGRTGMLGSSILRHLTAQGYTNIFTVPHSELDLTVQDAVDKLFKEHKFEYVFMCAGKVGGLYANLVEPADFLYQNLMIGANTVQAAYKYGVKKLINIGSVCQYPRDVPNPIKEEFQWSDKFNDEHQGYSIAKSTITTMCLLFNRQYNTDFLSLVPSNLYGINDNFRVGTGHVIAEVIWRIHNAHLNKMDVVTCYGSGNQRREFLYVDDAASACVKFMQEVDAKQVGTCVNVGSGRDISVKELVEMIKKTVGYSGEIVWNKSKPQGSTRRMLCCEKLHSLIDWKPMVDLEEGIRRTYSWFKEKCAI